MIREGDHVLLVSPEGKEFLIQVKRGAAFGTHRGNLDIGSLVGREFGCTIFSSKDVPFLVVRPTLYDFMKRVKRQTQIIYPKDVGYILLRLGIGPGARVVECGTGSGALTMALAFAVRPFGRVYSYDMREEFSRLARENLRRVGLDAFVSFKVKRAEGGFDERDVDAVFIDVKVPENLVDSVWDALKPGGGAGFLLPTANQVSSLLKALSEGFVVSEVCEILLRRYKHNPDRLRPDDLMNAHTGYLVFARKVER